MPKLRNLCLEILAICVAAVVLGAVANALNADGIVLGRNYFRVGVDNPPQVVGPGPHRGAVQPGRDTASGNKAPASPAHEEGGIRETNRNGEVCEQDDPVRELPDGCVRMDDTGLQMACFDFVFQQHAAMPDNPGFIVFVDARDEGAFNEEHIPGALLVDYWKLGRYLPEVLPQLGSAGVIIIYCSGGDCEDSRLLATSLIIDQDLSADSIYVYEGGIESWIANGKRLTEGGKP